MLDLRRDPRRLARVPGLVIGLLAAAVGCGDPGGGGGAPVQEHTGPGWVTIEAAPTEVQAELAVLHGQAFISPTWYRCCSGSATDTGVTVTWTNLTSGAAGPARQSAKYCWLLGDQLCGHTWSAEIPLQPGTNRIRVEAADPSGNSGAAQATVTRTAP